MSHSLLIEHGEAGGASVMFAENSVSRGEQSLVDAVTMVLLEHRAVRRVLDSYVFG